MKILIRATNWVGDAIMALPALQAVRARFLGAHVAILGLPYVVDLYRGQGIADELIGYDRNGAHRGVRGREVLAAELRQRQFDVALLFQNAFDAAWIAWRARIPQRIGYDRDGRRLLLTNPVRVPRPGEIPQHEKYYYLELLRRINWLDELPDASEIRLQVSSEGLQAAENKLQASGAAPGRLRIAIGAGAAYGSAKCWPPERFAQSLDAFVAGRDADVILFGSASESAVSNAIRSAMKAKAIDLVGTTQIAELPALLSRCDIFLGNDSGAMHVAAAAGIPLVAVFGPTDPLGTAPVTLRGVIVQERPYCSPCFLRRCPTDHRCMTSISPQRVSEALAESLVSTGVK